MQETCKGSDARLDHSTRVTIFLSREGVLLPPSIRFRGPCVYLLYLDASGTVDLQDSSSNYVLTGVAVHELTWFAVESRLQGLRGRFGLAAEAELHAKEICNPNPVESDDAAAFEGMDHAGRFQAWDDLIAKATSKAKLKRLQRERPFAHLGRKQRSELYSIPLEKCA